jgi:hypothetical protein
MSVIILFKFTNLVSTEDDFFRKMSIKSVRMSQKTVCSIFKKNNAAKLSW